jgi:hypothetical protein
MHATYEVQPIVINLINLPNNILYNYSRIILIQKLIIR